MTILDHVHERFIYQRRVGVLAEHIGRLLPETASLLDVGCGDGQVARRLMGLKPGLAIEGLDVLVRPNACLPVRAFDGTHIPLVDQAVDFVMFIDVLHHADDPRQLLAEAVRVARRGVIIKDHLLRGFLGEATLRAMDRVGNARYGVALPFHYLTEAEWGAVFRDVGLKTVCERRRLGLYPWWLNWCFGRGLHFMARLEKRDQVGVTSRTVPNIAESNLEKLP